MLKKVFLSFVFITALFLLPSKTFAQVVINEFSSSSSNDWVELYSNEDIDISGWILRDNASSIVKTIPNSTSIGPSGSVPKYYVIDAGSRLNTDTDKIRLLKSDDSTIVDQVSYGGEGEVCAPTGSQTIGRFPNGTGGFVRFSAATDWRENNTSQDPCPTLTPTPTIVPSAFPSLTPAQASNDYSNISISEYLPYPENGDEWVELYNGNDFEVNLNGWYIDDVVDGGSSPKAISGTINASGYKQFYLSSAFLNNDGDDVRLLNGDKSEKDKTSFETSIKGKSWSRDQQGHWCQSDPTPNSSNPDCPPATAATTLAPTSTSVLTSTPTKKITPTPIKIATISGTILGEEATVAAFFPLESTPVATIAPIQPLGKNTFLAKIFLGLGMLALFGAAFSLWYTRLRS